MYTVEGRDMRIKLEAPVTRRANFSDAAQSAFVDPADTISRYKNGLSSTGVILMLIRRRIDHIFGLSRLRSLCA